jgi:hypothetical protein
LNACVPRYILLNIGTNRLIFLIFLVK